MLQSWIKMRKNQEGVFFSAWALGTGRALTANQHVKVQHVCVTIPSVFKMPPKYAPNQKLTWWLHDYQRNTAKSQIQTKGWKTYSKLFFFQIMCQGLRLKWGWSKNTKAKPIWS